MAASGLCENCGTAIGGYQGRWRRVDGRALCLTCALAVMDWRRERTVEFLWQGGRPEVYFAAPAVGREPDHPDGPRRQTGVLAFTNKGVVFAQLGEYQARPSSAVAMLLGAGEGPYIVDTRNRLERRDLENASQPVLHACTDNAISFIETAPQVFVWVPGFINQLQWNCKKYCRWAGEFGMVQYEWLVEAGRIRAGQRVLHAFSNAIQQARSVAEDCREAIRLAQMDV